ncbi:MAG: phosphatase PAP2 family protein [Chloroflexota bacterium]
MNLQSWMEADIRWTERLRLAERPSAAHTLAAIAAHSGDSWFWALGLVIVWVTGEAQAKAWAVRLLAAIAALAAIVLLIKFGVRRRRPEGSWGTIYRATDPHSFPSGHAARAVLLAILVTAWGPPWLAAVLIPWAPLVSLSRVAMGLHYLSDVLAGAALGLVAATAALLIIP